MDQQANYSNIYSRVVAPETKWSSHGQTVFGLIYERRKALEWLVARGERLIKLGDGWFSTKAILVV